MVEPILTPNLTPADSDLSGSHPVLITRCIRRPAADDPVDSDRTPAPSTAVELSAVPVGNLTVVTVRGGSTAAVADPPKPAAPPPVRPKLVVLRGLRVGSEYPVLDGRNTIGRFVEKPVDIDMLPQEPDYQVWCSRLHAAITYDRGVVLVEDLNSLNGTWVNGVRLPAGQQRSLKLNDVVQVGTVQLRLVFG
jgi:hypothetical protein